MFGELLLKKCAEHPHRNVTLIMPLSSAEHEGERILSSSPRCRGEPFQVRVLHPFDVIVKRGMWYLFMTERLVHEPHVTEARTFCNTDGGNAVLNEN